MILTDIELNATIEIKLNRMRTPDNPKDVIFQSKVITSDEIEKLMKTVSVPCIAVEAIQVDGKVLNLSDRSVSVIATNEGKRYIWEKNVTLKAYRTKQGIFFYLIQCPYKGNTYNQRESYRVWLGLNGKSYINNRDRDIIIRDLSDTGVGIICDEDINLNVGDRVRITFTDNDSPLHPSSSSKRISQFRLTATVVRIEDQDRGRHLVGCEIVHESTLLSKYVSAKQREEAARLAGNQTKKTLTKEDAGAVDVANKKGFKM